MRVRRRGVEWGSLEADALFHAATVMSSQTARAHTFVVRIWLEPREVAGAVGEWRGEVRHVPSGRALRFQRLELVPVKLEELIKLEDHG